MLEHVRIRLRREMQAIDRPRMDRGWVMEDPNDGVILGRARPNRAWFGLPILVIHEAEDEPLLFTLRRRLTLPASWEVRDADGHHVGVVGTRYLEVCTRPSWLNTAASGPAGAAFQDPKGRELATLSTVEDGWLLSFAPELDGDPFTRMVLLGAALVWRGG
jgi:hypothetical protein